MKIAPLPANFRPLPIVPTIRRTFELLWAYRRLQLRLAAPGFILVTAGTALPTRAFWGLDQEQASKAIQGSSAHQVLPWMVALMLGSLLCVSFGAAWRRFLLLDRPPSVFTFDAPMRRYLTLLVIGNFVVVTVLMVVAAMIQSMPAGWAVLLVVIIAMLLAVMRYSLLFTAALAGNTELTPRRASEMMHGNLYRYTAVWLILALGTVCLDNLLNQILTATGVNGGTIPGAVAFGLLRGLFLVLMTSLTSSAAALTYDFIVRGGGPAPGRTQ